MPNSFSLNYFILFSKFIIIIWFDHVSFLLVVWSNSASGQLFVLHLSFLYRRFSLEHRSSSPLILVSDSLHLMAASMGNWQRDLYKADRPFRMFYTTNQRSLRSVRLTQIAAWFGFTAAELAQSVEHLTAEREVAGSIPGVGPILRVLKLLRNEGTLFALQQAGTLAWLGWPRKMAIPSPVGDVNIVSPISTFVLNTTVNTLALK